MSKAVRKKFSLTTMGKVLLFLAGFLFVSALNTGNNLLFVVSSCFFAVFVICLGYAATNLKDMNFELDVDDIGFVGQEIQIRCKVAALGDSQHYAIAFEDDFTPLIYPGEPVVLSSTIKPTHRGCYDLDNFCLFSLHPLGLVVAQACVSRAQLWVAPKPLRKLPSVFEAELEGALQTQKSGREGEYWMQKPYQEGEDASLINWNISARSLQEWVLIKSVSMGLAKDLCFDFDGLDEQTLEDCLSLAMGVVDKLCRERSDAKIWALDQSGTYKFMSCSREFVAIARWLAVVKCGDDIALPGGNVYVVNFNKLLKGQSDDFAKS